MIKNDREFRATLDAVQLAYSALADLSARRSQMHPNWFAVLAEGPVDQLRQLLRQLDEYLGVDVVGGEVGSRPAPTADSGLVQSPAEAT
jgi:hypothetical protein